MRSHVTGRRKRESRRIAPYAWLGTGAMALGIGAAALTGAGTAYADDAGSGQSASSSSAGADGSAAGGSSSTGTDSAGAQRDSVDEGADKESGSDDNGTVDPPDDADTAVEHGSESVDGDVIDVDLNAVNDAASQDDPDEEPAADDDAGGEEAVATLLPMSSAATRRESVDSVVPSTAEVAAQVAATPVDPNIAAVVDLGVYFPEAMAASPDGRYVYAGSTNVTMTSGSIAVIDTATNTVKKTITTDFMVTGLAVAPDGRIYAAGLRPVTESVAAAMVAIISTSHRVTKTITLGAGTGHYMPVAVTPDGKTVVVGWGAVTTSYVGAITTISTSSQKVVRTTTFQGNVLDLAVTPSGKTAVVAVDRYPASVLKIDLATGATTAIDLSSVASEVRSVAVTPGGLFAYVAYGGSSRDIAIVSLNSGDVVDTIAIGQGGSAEKIRLSADGTTLFATDFNSVHTIDIQSRATLDTLVVGPGVHYYSTAIALGRNGRIYLATHYDRSVTVVRLYPANAAPILTVSVGEPKASTGVVDGGVAAADPNGNPVTFSVSAPSRGKVTMTKYGAFKYTPTAAARHAAAAPNGPKTDSFVITANNGAGGVATVTVIVTIAPKNSAPTASAKVDKPNADTGVVTGKITGRDSDKDALSFSASAAPAKGSVVVNGDGTFTYTPTESARMVAGGSGARSADKSDKFTVTVSDGHGGTKAVTVSVTIAPLKSATTASKMWAAMDADTPDKLTAQLVNSGGKKKMIVYMTGIQGLFQNPDSVIDGALGNAGWLNPTVSQFIDNAVTMWSPSEIMLVGFSNGGQQMQNYAADGEHKRLVKSLVMFGAPLTKKADQIGQASSLGILDVEDRTYEKWTHADAVQSYNTNASDNWALFYRGVKGNSDTHHQGTYFDAAADFDKAVKDRKIPDDVKKIYNGWAKFDGNVVQELETRTR